MEPSRIGRARLAIICGKCGSERVYVFTGVDRVLIRCEGCGERIYSYYLDRDRSSEALPPQEADRFFVRQVEQELLNQVVIPARALYLIIREYRRRNGFAPTLREMRLEMGWASVNSVTHYLARLEEIGLIEREYGAVRGLRLVYVA